jgi:hypothetical protein
VADAVIKKRLIPSDGWKTGYIYICIYICIYIEDDEEKKTVEQ